MLFDYNHWCFVRKIIPSVILKYYIVVLKKRRFTERARTFVAGKPRFLHTASPSYTWFYDVTHENMAQNVLFTTWATVIRLPIILLQLHRGGRFSVAISKCPSLLVVLNRFRIRPRYVLHCNPIRRLRSHNDRDVRSGVYVCVKKKTFAI